MCTIFNMPGEVGEVTVCVCVVGGDRHMEGVCGWDLTC